MSATTTDTKQDFKVADLSLAAYGRHGELAPHGVDIRREIHDGVTMTP